MVIESKDITKDYAKEFINVVTMGATLIKDPNKKIRDNFIIVPGFIFVSLFIAGIAALVKLLGVEGSYVDLAIALSLVLFILSVFFYLRLISNLNTEMKKERNVTFTFSEEGIVYDDHKSEALNTKWDSYNSVIFCDHGVYFIPSEQTGVMIAISGEHIDEIRSFLKEKNIELEVIEQKI